MTTPNPKVLTGGETVWGTAIDNTGTDSFLVYGAGNTIIEGTSAIGGGNLVVVGKHQPYGWDTSTTISLGNAIGVVDQIKLDGSHNVISSEAGTALAGGSTVTIGVTGNGTGGRGYNSVSLDNIQGTTSVTLTGGYNTVALNGDANNTIVTGQADATVNVGSLTDDDLFGYTTSIQLSMSSNHVTGGDENFTIGGGYSLNTIALGDGNNSVSLTGMMNSISVWGGSNAIDAGSGYETVNILGNDGASAAYWTYDPDNPQAGPPTDTLLLAGLKDAVTATYENVVINGSAVTGMANINLGNGNNSVTLAGDMDAVALGNGTSNVNLTGSMDAVTVTDPTGIGRDNVSVGNGNGDVISLAYAGGTIAGSTAGTTTVTQASDAANVVNVYLPLGTGLISAGNGSDVFTANGAGSTVVAGNGNDTVTVGNGASVTLGNGTDVVTALDGATVIAGYGNDTVTTADGASVTLGSGNDVVSVGVSSSVVAGDGKDTVTAGGGAYIKLGNGADLVNANGGSSTVIAGYGNDTVNANGGSSTVTLGYGSDTVSATGVNSTVNIGALKFSHDSVTVGSSDTVNISSGVDNITGVAGDKFYLTFTQANTVLTMSGNNNMAFLGTDSSAEVALNQAQSGDIITVQADVGNTYAGTVSIVNFNPNDMMQLNGLVGGFDGHAITSMSEVIANTTAGAFADTLHLQGGGAISFLGITGFTASEFSFGTATGRV